MKPLAECSIAIVGLGLMGSSLAGALRGKCREIVGVARRAEAIKNALARNLIDRGSDELAEGVNQVDVVVLATPVRAIMQQLEQVGPLLPEGCLVMDLGSTKAQIVAKMEQLPDHVQPLGAHPMCGKELSGIEAADPTLYQHCTFILTPLSRTSEEALALGRVLAEAVGAHPLVLSPERQDFLVATLSHLPYLLACALVRTADATTSAEPAAWEIVAGGFRDTSRVASSEVTMMIDILMTNRDEVSKAVDVFQAQLGKLTRLIETGEEEDLRKALLDVREERMRMFP